MARRPASARRLPLRTRGQLDEKLVQLLELLGQPFRRPGGELTVERRLRGIEVVLGHQRLTCLLLERHRGDRTPLSTFLIGPDQARVGVTSMYLPKTSITLEPFMPNTRRYLPPTRTSISQTSRDMPIDFGTHHRRNSSGLVQASNTMRGWALKVRLTTSSRSDVRSVVVRFFTGAGSVSLLASIDPLLLFQFFDDLVQLVEACGPKLAVPLDPGRLFLQPAWAEPAGPHAS